MVRIAKSTAWCRGSGLGATNLVTQALNEAVNEIAWSDGRKVLKIIFLVGDAPPQMKYDEVKYPEICKMAVEKNLIINTIQCGSMQATIAD